VCGRSYIETANSPVIDPQSRDQKLVTEIKSLHPSINTIACNHAYPGVE
jgi:hypothetical protein